MVRKRERELRPQRGRGNLGKWRFSQQEAGRDFLTTAFQTVKVFTEMNPNSDEFLPLKNLAIALHLASSSDVSSGG